MRANLGQDVQVLHGVRYWLVIHFTTSGCGVRHNVYWATTQKQHWELAESDQDCNDVWVQYPRDLAFSLIGDIALPTESASWGAIKALYND